MVKKYRSGDEILKKVIELRHSLSRRRGLDEHVAEVEGENKKTGGIKRELFNEDRDRN
jgi:hypothetical protein